MARRRNTRPIVIAGVTLLGGVALYALGVLGPIIRPIHRTITSIAIPFRAVGTTIAEQSGSNPEDSADIRELLRTVETLQLENAQLHNLYDENQELKTALGFVEREHDLIIHARVVSESPGDTFRGIIIDRGSQDGVQEGSIVLTVDGIAIGKIYDTKDYSATVQLLTDSMSRLAVTVQNGARTIGVLEGERGLSMNIALIPQSEIITSGDIIVTSGAEPGIRKGYPVGIVERVRRETQDPFQTAIIAPFTSSERPSFIMVAITTTDK